MAIKDITKVKTHLFMCNGGTCKLRGAEESSAAIRAAITESGMDEEIHTTKTLCNGRCKDGPIENAGEFIRQLVTGEFLPDHILFEYGSQTINTMEQSSE
jgi:NADH:ubiquinone oxidoreductase subunit E